MDLPIDKNTHDWFIGLLKTNKVQVIFTKGDGTERTMNCTLREDIAVPYVKTTDKKAKKENLDIVPCWDIDKGEWRSFKISSLLYVNFKLGE